jgi:hypothetical protein
MSLPRAARRLPGDAGDAIDPETPTGLPDVPEAGGPPRRTSDPDVGPDLAFAARGSEEADTPSIADTPLDRPGEVAPQRGEPESILPPDSSAAALLRSTSTAAPGAGRRGGTAREPSRRVAMDVVDLVDAPRTQNNIDTPVALKNHYKLLLATIAVEEGTRINLNELFEALLAQGPATREDTLALVLAHRVKLAAARVAAARG